MAIGTEVARLFVTLGANTAEFVKGMDMSAQKMASFGRQMTDMGKRMTVGLTLPIVGFATKAVMAFNESERAAAKMEAVIASTGASAWTTSAAMQNLATSIQNTTTFEDDLVVSAEAVLLTFKSVRNELGAGNDVFDRTMRAATDLATVMGSDLEGAAMQLGKALEDPVRGVTALRRSGVSFTQAQLDMIKSLVESNQKLEAQRLILAEVESQFGGAAAAVAETAGGQWAQALNRVDDAFERIGAIIAPWVATIANALATAFEWFSKLPRPLQNLIGILAGLVAIAGPVVLAIGMITTAFVTMSAAQLAAMGYLALFAVGLWAATDGAKALAEALYGPTEIIGTELVPELADVAQYGEKAADQIAGLAEVIRTKATGGLTPFTVALEQMEQAFKTGAVSAEVAAGVLNTLMPDSFRRAGASGEDFIAAWMRAMEGTAEGIRVLKWQTLDFANMTGVALQDWHNKVVDSFDAVGDALSTLKNKTKTTFRELMNALRNQLDSWRNWRTNLTTLIKRGVPQSVIQDFIQRGPEEMASVVSEMVNANDNDLAEIVDLWTSVANAPGRAVTAVENAATRFESAARRIKRAIQDIMDAGATYSGAVTLTFKGQREMGVGATGAIVRNPTLALIGEAGPEAVVPLNQMPGASPLPGGGGTNVSVSVSLDRKVFSRQQEYLVRASGF